MTPSKTGRHILHLRGIGDAVWCGTGYDRIGMSDATYSAARADCRDCLLSAERHGKEARQRLNKLERSR